jgi:hypothetical protein
MLGPYRAATRYRLLSRFRSHFHSSCFTKPFSFQRSRGLSNLEARKWFECMQCPPLCTVRKLAKHNRIVIVQI